jgi:hypothetical protein
MDKEIVTAEPFHLLAKTPWFRPLHAPSACRGDSEADVFIIHISSIFKYQNH